MCESHGLLDWLMSVSKEKKGGPSRRHNQTHEKVCYSDLSIVNRNNNGWRSFARCEHV